MDSVVMYAVVDAFVLEMSQDRLPPAATASLPSVLGSPDQVTAAPLDTVSAVTPFMFTEESTFSFAPVYVGTTKALAMAVRNGKAAARFGKPQERFPAGEAGRRRRLLPGLGLGAAIA